MNRPFSFRKTDWFTIANLSFNGSKSIVGVGF